MVTESVKTFFEQLRAQDPQLQREYERQAPRFEALRALIAARGSLDSDRR